MSRDHEQAAAAVGICLYPSTIDGRCRFYETCEFLYMDLGIDPKRNPTPPCPKNKDYTACPGYRAQLMMEVESNI